MSPRTPVGRRSAAWAAVGILLCACATLGWWVCRQPLPFGVLRLTAESLDWQPRLAFAQPWRAWSAVAVHYSGLHLVANLAGAVLTAAFGVVARVPRRAAWAWLVAWPLTQFGLLVEPALLHYGGLSGVLHAGVMIVVVFLLADGHRAQRIVALAVLGGVAVKLVGEAPWGPPLRQPPGWDISVAPIAHASGALAGVLCALVANAWPGARRDNHRHA